MKIQSFKEKNNKRTVIIAFTITCILLIASVFFYRSFAFFEEKKNFNIINGHIENPGDLYFSYYIDDILTYEMPSKESGYILTEKSNCTNGVTIDWDIFHWRALVNYDQYTKEDNGRVKCNLYFKTATFPEAITSCGKGGVNAGECIKNYKNLDSNNLIVDDTQDHNLRYIGENPNNYVTFNNELWRIIGVMENIDDGSGTKETRIKLIRNESIGDFVWDSTETNINEGWGTNEWSTSTLMQLLNPHYETSEMNNSLYWNRTSGNCFNGQNKANAACDFTTSGLKESAKEYFQDAVWHTGTNDDVTSHYNDILASKFYELEQSNNTGKICTSGTMCNDTEKRTTKWTGKIGLLSPSDYSYATSGGSKENRISCLNTISFNWQNEDLSYCKENNWLHDDIKNQWTIMPYAYNSFSMGAFFIYNKGGANVAYCGNTRSIKPVLYLKSHVKIENGTGSANNPFTLSKE